MNKPDNSKVVDLTVARTTKASRAKSGNSFEKSNSSFEKSNSSFEKSNRSFEQSNRSSGQHDAITQAIAHHEADLRHFLDARLSCHADKDDIIQDVFIRLKKQKSVKDGLPFEASKAKAYLMITASNLIHDKYRYRKVRTDAQADLLENQKNQLQNESPEDIVAANQKLERIMKVLDNLPPKCSQAFLLSRFHHHGYREIAEQLGVSASMVEKYIARAIQELKTVYYPKEKK